MHADRQTMPLLGAIIICTLPHLSYLSPWVVVPCVALWLYCAAAVRFSWRLPKRFLLRIFSGAAFAAAMTTHEGLTIEAFVALLALMAVLKLLEIRDLRDRMITVILCYFLIASRLFYGDSIGVMLYILFSVLVATAVLVRVNQPQTVTPTQFKLSGIILLQSLPFLLIFFLLFPRFQGGLWGRTHLNTAQTGFSDRVGFGDIAKLAQSTEVAFRVEFDGSIPPADQLYWRGIVLWQFDGRTWLRGGSNNEPLPPQKRAAGDISYTITLEPNNQHWLFTLDRPLEIDYAPAHLQRDYTVFRWRPITSRITYRAISVLRPLPPRRLHSPQSALQLPEGGNPRSRNLAASLAKAAGSDERYIESVLSYLRDQHFSYTLQPPPLDATEGAGPIPEDLVDRFLFGSKKGFCEHFASAFAFLMRAAGVPARVVAGYQGGEYNPYGNYLVVRQSAAHSWCEVWLADRGWVRVDPTSVVAPARVGGDVATAVPAGETTGLLSLLETGPLGQWVRTWENVWDFWNNRWNLWVMSYSFNEQASLFTAFGLELQGTEQLAAALVGILAIATLAAVVVFAFLFRDKKGDRDPVAATWLDLCRKLDRVGLPRAPAQGPLDYLTQIKQQRPDLTDPARELILRYVRLRYAGRPDQRDILQFRSLVKRFSPGRRGPRASLG